nr:MAG TPA: hypothetical protein [Caudoviricetes sp.]
MHSYVFKWIISPNATLKQIQYRNDRCPFLLIKV